MSSLQKFLIGGVVFLVWLFGCRYVYVFHVHTASAEPIASVLKKDSLTLAPKKDSLTLTAAKTEPSKTDLPVAVVPQDSSAVTPSSAITTLDTLHRRADSVMTIPKTLAVVVGRKKILSDFEEFLFPQQSALPTMSENNHLFLKSLAERLEKNSTEVVLVSGAYLSRTERDAAAGIYENVGLARAAYIKNRLTNEFGISPDQVLIGYDEFAENTLTKPASFFLGKSSAKRPAFAAAPRYEFQMMTFSDNNFVKSSDVVKPTKAFELYADSLVRYIRSHPKTGITIVSHTDHKGNAKKNLELSQSRGEAVANYLRALGIRATIEVMGKGNSEKIASSKTQSGQKRNRRFVIQLQKL
jgi:outer membrane protein OmpA-like peptidoglycan-associated protein